MVKSIGCHLSSARGFTAMAQAALQIGANTFQYFSRNPRGGKAREFIESDLKEFLKILEENKFSHIVSHAPYTMNLCSSNEHIRDYSQSIFAEDIQRLENVPGSYYNFHPGSHTGQGIDKGIIQITDALNNTLRSDQTTTVLLETMTGKGSEVGGKIEDLARIIKGVELKEKLGVCIDTCHIFDAGYDIVNNLEGVLEEIDKKIGISKVKAVHLNDSKNALGSKKDRHEQLGRGNIGLEALLKIVENNYLKNLVFILETPQESLEGYAQEIDMIKSRISL